MYAQKKKVVKAVHFNIVMLHYYCHKGFPRP